MCAHFCALIHVVCHPCEGGDPAIRDEGLAPGVSDRSPDFGFLLHCGRDDKHALPVCCSRNTEISRQYGFAGYGLSVLFAHETIVGAVEAIPAIWSKLNPGIATTLRPVRPNVSSRTGAPGDH